MINAHVLWAFLCYCCNQNNQEMCSFICISNSKVTSVWNTTKINHCKQTEDLQKWNPFKNFEFLKSHIHEANPR